MENTIEAARQYIKDNMDSHLYGGEARQLAIARMMVTFAELVNCTEIDIDIPPLRGEPIGIIQGKFIPAKPQAKQISASNSQTQNPNTEIVKLSFGECITSDEEVKEGDYAIAFDNKLSRILEIGSSYFPVSYAILNSTDKYDWLCSGQAVRGYFKKIISTKGFNLEGVKNHE